VSLYDTLAPLGDPASWSTHEVAIQQWVDSNIVYLSQVVLLTNFKSTSHLINAFFEAAQGDSNAE
jgi:hypothetical protein